MVNLTFEAHLLDESKWNKYNLTTSKEAFAYAAGFYEKWKFPEIYACNCANLEYDFDYGMRFSHSLVFRSTLKFE